MACPSCRRPSGPCPPGDDSLDQFTSVLDGRCSRRVYVPCNVRSHLAQYIEHCRALAIQRGDKDTEPALHTSEGIPYGVLLWHGHVSSKIHGPGWEDLVTDYGLHRGDTMTVRLENYGTFLGVDIYRGEELLLPLPWVALEDFSDSERELVNSSFYTRGVNLNYRQLYSMTHALFNESYILCRPFVHRLSTENVNQHLMMIPNLVVRSLKDFVVVPRDGVVSLEACLEESEEDRYVTIPASYHINILSGKMIFNKEGFRDFLQASAFVENMLMLITFKELDGLLAVIFSAFF